MKQRLQRLTLVEMVVYDPGIAGTRTLRYSNLGYVTRSTETPADTHYDARIDSVVDVSRHAFGRMQVTGSSSIAFADLELDNEDGALDALADYAFDGRAMTVYRADIPASGVIPAYPSGFTTYHFTMLSGYTKGTQFVVKMRGLETALNQPIQSTKFAGDNVAPDGLEGGEELTGVAKPIALGRVYGAALKCVNAQKQIYQIHDDEIDAIDGLYDAGNNIGDPTDWEEITGTPFTNNPSFIACSTDNPDLMMATCQTGAGAAGEIGVSTDGGATWTLLTHGFTGEVDRVAWGGPVGNRCFVIVGGNQIATSDGVTVTMQTSGLGAGHALFGLTWFEKAQLWITGGDGGGNTLRTSPTGVTWTARTFANFETIYAMFAGPSRVVAGTIGGTPTAAYSDDGINWTLATTSNGTDFPAGGALYDGLFANGEYRMVGGSGVTFRSIDGRSWGRIEGPFDGLAGGSAEVLDAIAYGFGCWVYGTNSGHFYYENRTGWIKYPLPWSNAAVGSVVFDGRRFVSVGGGIRKIIRTLHGEEFASLTDLEDDTLAPGPGNWKWISDPGGSYVRIGSPPYGIVTADISEGATAADRTPGQLWKRVLERVGKVAGTDFSSGDITALDAACSDEAGIYITEEITLGAVLDLIAATPGASSFTDRAGLYRIKQLTLPSGSTVVDFAAGDLIGRLERAEGEIPTYQHILSYRRNYTPMTNGVATFITAEVREQLAREWSTIIDTDSSVQTEHLLARQVSVQTLFADATGAGIEVARRQALFGDRRDWYPFTVEDRPEYRALELFDVVGMSHSRYGLSVGLKFRILGIEPNTKRREITLFLWGGV